MHVNIYACMQGVDYLVGPRFERQICLVNGETPGGPSGPSLADAAPRAAAPPVSLGKGALPDLANWTFAGDVQYNGRPAEKWAFNQTVRLPKAAMSITSSLIHHDIVKGLRAVTLCE